ncbi:hypothetical protein TorRG33x02_182820 [Trema orientale]|uniref:RNase H type-1 domain-containing protein n=1 Tax=Trema orientale TaxID=63057 RepID=A0A2P5EK92_TREOI|nr:hypothetical protein TorRG33x02_182820 [Trema orientale]
MTAFVYGCYEGAISMPQAELMASRDGLSLVFSKGFLVYFIECDALFVVKDVTSGAFDSSDGVLVQDIVYLLSCVRGGICYHVPRIKNMVAHTLASVWLGSSFVCIGDRRCIPPCVTDVV